MKCLPQRCSIGKLILGDYVQEDLAKIELMVAKGISFEVAKYIVLGPIMPTSAQEFCN
jgi:hypothetical protein